MSEQFKYYIGVDQTGAVDRKGRPRPLTATLLWTESSQLRFIPGLSLASFSRPSLDKVFSDLDLSLDSRDRVLICLDSVLGLPACLKTPLRQVLKDIRGFCHDSKAYGALTAYHFFRRYLPDPEAFPPARQVELQVKANSVFNLKPFQKNIGCGTYRILRDLAEDTATSGNWFRLWPQEEPSGQFVLCEGYPSFFWKTTLGCAHRDLKALEQFGHDFKNLDEADSFILAYGCYRQQDFMKTFKHEDRKLIALEGWIYGVEPF